MLDLLFPNEVGDISIRFVVSVTSRKCCGFKKSYEMR